MNAHHWLELAWPLLSSPMLRVWLRKRRCHPWRGCLRYLPERIGRPLPPIIPRKF